MGLRKSEMTKVEVDMVPLIDIISLLLMFLVMVGDMAKNANSVRMKLPRADMARDDKDLPTEGRIVVQMKKDDADGRYWAIVQGSKFELVKSGASKTLISFLEEQITRSKALKEVKEGPDGSVPIPVKLRIPEEAPMFEVERLVQSLAQARLTNVQYAASKK